MNILLFTEQALNGVQFGMTLFLMAAGMTLILGIMNLLNLAHGSLYTVGAYAAVKLQAWSGSFVLGILLAIPAVALLGMVLEIVALRTLYRRDHLDQALCTFGLILFLDEMVRVIWGLRPLPTTLPPLLDGSVELVPGISYSTYRLAVIAVGLVVALCLYLTITRTRIGMLIRAGANDREMIGALGIDINTLYTIVFGIGAALAGLAAMMVAPLVGVQSSMGDNVVILTLVVITVGGIGSVRGAFLAALLVGVFDTFGRALLPPALSSVAIYVLMAVILLWRPRGLFPAIR